MLHHGLELGDARPNYFQRGRDGARAVSGCSVPPSFRGGGWVAFVTCALEHPDRPRSHDPDTGTGIGEQLQQFGAPAADTTGGVILLALDAPTH